MKFYKLNRVFSDNWFYIPNFKETFPELKHLTNGELASRFKKLNLRFYEEKEVAVNKWVRLTLPFALIIMLLMFLFLPIWYMVTGRWTYSIDKGRLYNWIRSLRLIN